MRSDDFTKTMIRLAIVALEQAVGPEEPASMITGKSPDKLQGIMQCHDCHRSYFEVGEMLRKISPGTWLCSRCQASRSEKRQ